MGDECEARIRGGLHLGEGGRAVTSGDEDALPGQRADEFEAAGQFRGKGDDADLAVGRGQKAGQQWTVGQAQGRGVMRAGLFRGEEGAFQVDAGKGG